MKKLVKYDGNKTFMFPNGVLATPSVMVDNFPAILTFAHVIETDEKEEVCFAVQNLSALRSMYEIDASLSEKEAIAKIQEIINTPPAEEPTEPTAEERIASSLEFQTMMMLPDEEVAE